VIRFNLNNETDLQSSPLQQQNSQQTHHRIDLNKVKSNSDFVIMEKSASDSSLTSLSSSNNKPLLKYNFSNTNSNNSNSTFPITPSSSESTSSPAAANTNSILFSPIPPPPPPPPPPPSIAPLTLRPFRTKTANATTPHFNYGCFFYYFVIFMTTECFFVFN